MASCFCVLLSYSLAFARSSLFSTFDFFPFPAHPKISCIVIVPWFFSVSQVYDLHIGGRKKNWFTAICNWACTNQFLFKLATMAFYPATLQILLFVKTIISISYKNVIVVRREI